MIATGRNALVERRALHDDRSGIGRQRVEARREEVQRHDPRGNEVESARLRSSKLTLRRGPPSPQAHNPSSSTVARVTAVGLWRSPNRVDFTWAPLVAATVRIPSVARVRHFASSLTRAVNRQAHPDPDRPPKPTPLTTLTTVPASRSPTSHSIPGRGLTASRPDGHGPPILSITARHERLAAIWLPLTGPHHPWAGGRRAVATKRRQLGGVDRLQSGRWRERTTDDATGERISLGSYPTKAADRAGPWRRRSPTCHAGLGAAGRRRHPPRGLCPEWLATRLGRGGEPLRPRVSELYESELRLHILPVLGRCRSGACGRRRSGPGMPISSGTA